MTTADITPNRPVAAPQSTPDLVGAFRVITETTWASEPMTTERRAELIDELIAWADDPAAADWEHIDSLS
jgi:hypothetical protein